MLSLKIYQDTEDKLNRYFETLQAVMLRGLLAVATLAQIISIAYYCITGTLLITPSLPYEAT